MERFSTLLALCEGIHRSSVDSSNKGPVTRNIEVSLMLPRTHCWADTLMSGDLGRHAAQVMGNAKSFSYNNSYIDHSAQKRKCHHFHEIVTGCTVSYHLWHKKLSIWRHFRTGNYTYIWITHPSLPFNRLTNGVQKNTWVFLVTLQVIAYNKW